MVAVLACALVIATAPASDFEKMWTVGPFPSGGRTPCPTDPIAYQMVEGTFQPPKEGDKVAVAGGQDRPWHLSSPGADGWFTGRELNGDTPIARSSPSAIRS